MVVYDAAAIVGYGVCAGCGVVGDCDACAASAGLGGYSALGVEGVCEDYCAGEVADFGEEADGGLSVR